MTDQQMFNLFSIQRDATIAVRAGAVVFLNASASALFPDLTVGDGADKILPLAILEMENENLSCTSTIDHTPYTILGAQAGDMLVYTLVPQEQETAEQEGQLLERVSGTMRRTLTVLNMATEYLLPVIDRIDEPRQRANLTVINKAYYQLQRLCDNMDYFYRLSENETRLYLEELDFVEFCRDLAQSVDHFAKRVSHRVQFKTDIHQLVTAIDRQKMTKLILNLVSNSLKHLKTDGSLTLSLAKQGADAVITVRDTGSGIEPSHIAEVFAQYKTRRSNTDIDAGAGLGLHIAQEIARLHGGTLLISSGHDRGTAVRLRIPLTSVGDSGLLQEMSIPYRESDGGMQFILTELSDVLDDEAFAGKYY